MSITRSPRRGMTALCGCLLLIFCAYQLSQKPQIFHPTLNVDYTQELDLHFILKPQPDLKTCETVLGRISKATLNTCTQCRVSKLKCEPVLTPEQRKLVSNQPVAFPTASFSDGVIAYLSLNSTLAQDACQSSQKTRQSIACHPAHVQRGTDPLMSTDIIGAVQTIWTISAVIPGLLAIFLLAHAALNRPLPSIGHSFNVALSILGNSSRRTKQILVATTDAFSLALSLWLTLSLRLEQWYSPPPGSVARFATAILIGLVIFAAMGLYRPVVRHLSAQAAWTVLKAVLIYTAAIFAWTFLNKPEGIPPSSALLYGLIALALMSLSRLTARNWFSQLNLRTAPGKQRASVLIYGAGSAGIQLNAALTQSRETRPVAFLDDDVRLQGREIAGLRVHSPKEIGRLITRHGVTEILIALPSASRSRRADIIRRLEAHPVHVQVLPDLADLARGKIKVSDLREVEIEDLLGRDHVSPDDSLLRRDIEGRVVMVTGAGGSIGSELCRQICHLGAKSLVLFESSEIALYNIERELSGLSPKTAVFPLLGSVTDAGRIQQAIQAYRAHTVFHAAAYKHVPLVESNPAQGVLNNILGTWHTAMAALEEQVESFVLISTDKAVRPTNVMGATKRMAEMILQALHEKHGSRTRFTMVRFGNVLGSSGSVVPLFRTQIKHGGPVTVTDPRIIRYFMTIPEAAQLVIQAGAMGKGGEVFVLDMGEPVKILDLAKRMISLAGLSEKSADNPSGDIEIVFTGLRPGEKLYEELLIGNNVTPTEHRAIQKAHEPTPQWDPLQEALKLLEDTCRRGDAQELRTLLQRTVPEFMPQATNITR